MIYSKPINEIVWEDVVDFCNAKISEGATLDYKKDFPNNLQRSIASFANTMGGIILIGVNEDEESKPILPLEGINFERGISERIINIVLSNITPPVIPEIQVCTNLNKTRAIVVIRIPQSDLAPHAINKNTEVYIRTGNRNYFETLATVDNLFWLSDNRNKSINLRENSIQDAKTRFNKFYDNELGEAVKRGYINFSPNTSKLTLIITPSYPYKSYGTPPKLREILRKILVKDYFGTSDSFPIGADFSSTKLFQNGINMGRFLNNYAYYTELTLHGIFYYQQNLFGKLIIGNEKPLSIIRFQEVIARIDQFLQSAEKFYTIIGFNGLLQFYFSIDGLEGFTLKINIDDKSFTTFEDRVDFQKTILKNQIVHKKKNIIFNTVCKLAWAYNWDINIGYLDSFDNQFIQL